MYKLVSLPLYEQCISGCSGWAGLRKELQQLGCDGVEAIWSGTEIPKGFPRGLAVGYHLAFQADWLDFFREDKTALIRKFGSLDAARSFYGGWGPAHLMQFYRDDLARAKALGVRYIVFHVTDVSIEETYTYQWEHTHREVIDTAAGIINDLLAGESTDRKAVAYREDDRYVYITGEDFSYTFNKLTGVIGRIVYKNHSFLDEPMELNIWRAPTDNDRVVKKEWYAAGYDCMQTRAYSNEFTTL